MSNNSKQTKRNAYKPFCVSTGRAFINEFDAHDRDNKDPVYFAKVALITGKTGEGDDAKSRIQYLDLLVGSSLKNLARKALESGSNPLSDLPVFVEVHNLHLFAEPSEDGSKAYLNSQGILTDIWFQGE